MPDSSTPAFVQAVDSAHGVFVSHAHGAQVTAAKAPEVLTQALRTHQADTPEVYAALDLVSADIVREIKSYGAIAHVPAAATPNLRNQMYVVYDTLRLLTKEPEKADALFPNGDAKKLGTYEALLEKGTRYIPTWVKIAVALALGLGTMVGWKRIVVTVGEKIGKSHLTYGMGAAAELMAASTILLAQFKGMPVSTTHILSSGVAGAMAGNGSGVQASTVRNIALAWVTTLPAAMAIAGVLYVVLLQVAKIVA